MASDPNDDLQTMQRPGRLRVRPMSGGAIGGGRGAPVPRPPAARPASREEPRSFDSTELFRGETEIRIVHQNAVYHLKITRQGKLILNK